MFSVIIPLYNKKESILSTIQSVLNQTYQDFELIIVDDGSTDGSLELVMQLSDSRLKIFSKKNEGVSSTRNFGIKKSKYDLIALLDGDDLWNNCFLEEMNRVIVEFPNASIYGSAYSFLNSNGSKTIVDYCLPRYFRGYVPNYFKSATQNILFTSSSVVLKKECFQAVDGFDPSLKKGEDIDLWIKLALKYPVAYVNKPLAVYRLNAQNRAMNNIVPENNCLIWNLNRYSNYELINTDLKYFLDTWRLAHIENFLEGNKREVKEIDTLVATMDMSKFSYFWSILFYLPKSLRSPIYKTRKNFRKNMKRISRIFIPRRLN